MWTQLHGLPVTQCDQGSSNAAQTASRMCTIQLMDSSRPMVAMHGKK